MSSKIFDLSGKVSLVSGAAQGMGKAMAVALAEAGSDMAIVDLNGEGLSETASYIESESDFEIDWAELNKPLETTKEIDQQSEKELAAHQAQGLF